MAVVSGGSRHNAGSDSGQRYVKTGDIRSFAESVSALWVGGALNSLASQYGLATQYFANTHPSIGNYFMLTTGQLVTNDDGFTRTVGVDNIVRDLIAAGKTWKSYAESIPTFVAGHKTLHTTLSYNGRRNKEIAVAGHALLGVLQEKAMYRWSRPNNERLIYTARYGFSILALSLCLALFLLPMAQGAETHIQQPNAARDDQHTNENRIENVMSGVVNSIATNA